MRIIGLILGVGLLIGVVMGGAFLWDSYLLSPEKDAPDIGLTIPSGMTVDEIARVLEERGIITSRFLFKSYVKFAGAQASLQAGEYLLKPGMSFRAVVNTLSHAGVQEIQLTIPEGYTAAQIGAAVHSVLPEISELDWQTVLSQPSSISVATELLAGIPSGHGLEGYLFPDTYRFRLDADAKTIAETMILTLSRRLAENEIVVPNHLVMSNGMTFHEVMTLASIIEREVRSPEDMAHVAGIFLTRMKIGMALQADATVNYVTGKKDAAVSLEDTGVDSPYNTYKHLGLPPGPISNPGMNAIKAVLYPIDSDDLYYLTSPEGEVIYAKTFDQHVKNKYQYLK